MGKVIIKRRSEQFLDFRWRCVFSPATASTGPSGTPHQRGRGGPADEARIDGEAARCDGDGLAILDRLHSRACDSEVLLYAFDLLKLDGKDWRPRPLEEGKARLSRLLVKTQAGIQYIEGDGAPIFAYGCKLGAEGIVSKAASIYRSGPAKA
jgi:ATP-dependent DNA ligase